MNVWCAHRNLDCSAATDEAADTGAPTTPEVRAVLLIDADAFLHWVLTKQCMIACSCPQAAAPVATNSVQQIREARLQPLKIALQDAIALHTKATGVREALEAEVRCPARQRQELGVWWMCSLSRAVAGHTEASGGFQLNVVAPASTLPRSPTMP